MRRWVLWDVGDVLELCGDATWQLRFTTRWAQRVGLDVERFEAVLDQAGLPDITTSSGHEQDFWRGYADAVGVPRTQLAELVRDFWNSYCGQANTELIDFAADLRRKEGSAGGLAPSTYIGQAILSNSADGARCRRPRHPGR